MPVGVEATSTGMFAEIDALSIYFFLTLPINNLPFIKYNCSSIATKDIP